MSHQPDDPHETHEAHVTFDATLRAVGVVIVAVIAFAYLLAWCG